MTTTLHLTAKFTLSQSFQGSGNLWFWLRGSGEAVAKLLARP